MVSGFLIKTREDPFGNLIVRRNLKDHSIYSFYKGWKGLRLERWHGAWVATVVWVLCSIIWRRWLCLGLQNNKTNIFTNKKINKNNIIILNNVPTDFCSLLVQSFVMLLTVYAWDIFNTELIISEVFKTLYSVI